MKFVTIGYRDKFCVAINIFIIIKNKKNIGATIYCNKYGGQS